MANLESDLTKLASLISSLCANPTELKTVETVLVGVRRRAGDILGAWAELFAQTRAREEACASHQKYLEEWRVWALACAPNEQCREHFARPLGELAPRPAALEAQAALCGVSLAPPAPTLPRPLPTPPSAARQPLAPLLSRGQVVPWSAPSGRRLADPPGPSKKRPRLAQPAPRHGAGGDDRVADSQDSGADDDDDDCVVIGTWADPGVGSSSSSNINSGVARPTVLQEKLFGLIDGVGDGHTWQTLEPELRERLRAFAQSEDCRELVQFDGETTWAKSKKATPTVCLAQKVGSFGTKVPSGVGRCDGCTQVNRPVCLRHDSDALGANPRLIAYM